MTQVIIPLADLPVANSKQLLILIHHNMIERAVFRPTFLVMHNRMPVAKSSPFHILSTQPNMVAFNYECCKCKGFGNSPVNTFTTLDHCSALLKNLLHCSVGLEAFRQRSNCLPNTFQYLRLNPAKQAFQ